MSFFEGNWDAKNVDEAKADVQTWKRRVKRYQAAYESGEYEIDSLRHAQDKLREAEETLSKFESN